MNKIIIIFCIASLFVVTTIAAVIAVNYSTEKNTMPKPVVTGERPGLKSFFIEGAGYYYLYDIHLDIFRRQIPHKEVEIGEEVSFKVKLNFGTTI